MKVSRPFAYVISAISLLLLVLFLPGVANAASDTVTDPSGDVDSNYPDITSVTYKNADRAVVMKVFLAGADDDLSGNASTVSMKWGKGAKTCWMNHGTGWFDDAPACGDIMSADSTCGATFTEGNPTIVKIPRKCIKPAADALKFRVSTYYNGPIINPGSDPSSTVNKDTTVWSAKIDRG